MFAAPAALLDQGSARGRASVSLVNGQTRCALFNSGWSALPDGRKQEPGGWNRVVLRVEDLPGTIAALKQAGLRFRNEMESGPGGKQVQLEDPDGNPIELFEPAAH